MWRCYRWGVFLMLSWYPVGARLIAQTAPERQGDSANYKFAVELYGQLGKTPGNLFFSPSSISTCLSMAQAGARGTTASQMAQVLGLSKGQTSNAQPFQIVHGNGPIELNEANGLWIQAGYSFLPKYLGLLSRDFGAAVRQADFVHDPAASAGMINHWVADQTKGRIQEVVSPSSFDEYTRMVLANAIYFKGAWAAKFESGATRVQPFTLADGTKVQVPLMTHIDHLKYIGNEGFQAVEIPYNGGTISMVVFLPRKTDGLEQLEAWLTPAFLASWLERLQPKDVELYLPGFKLESSFVLNKHLQQMGMSNAFSLPGADFSGIDGTTKLCISSVFHKAWVEVNEQGTEAAAATALIAATSSAASEPRPRPPVFRADHPFLFIIRQVRSGRILFMGRLSNPTA